MSSDFHYSELSSPLVGSLNALLVSLSLPFILETPLDLTPSLLLAIVESLLQTRLPIDRSTRESRDRASKIQAMKVFLGVLESDVVRRDVGLSDIDPRRLAAGEWEETVFVAELLCWLGKQKGLLPADVVSTDQLPERIAHGHIVDRTTQVHPPRTLSPSTRSTLTNSVNSGLSVDEEDELESNTTLQSAPSDRLGIHRAHVRHPSPSEDRPRHHPRCIHEIEDPSFLLSQDTEGFDDGSERVGTDDGLFASDPSYCSCAEETGDTSADGTFMHSATHHIRYDGYIEEVDAELELRAFDARRAIQARPRNNSARAERAFTGDKIATPRVSSRSPETRLLTRHTSPGLHTVALMNERARLLSDLADFNPRR